MIARLFKSHPETVGETYVQHLGSASAFGVTMIGGGVACLLHGIFPFLFKSAGSRAICDLHRRMVTHRHRDPARHGAESVGSGDLVDTAA